MRVCFISHTAKRGGAERALVELIHALRARGVECRCLLPSRGPLLDLLESGSVPVGVVPYPWWAASKPSLRRRLRRSLKTLRAARPVAAFVRRWRCDVVYSNTIAVGVGALAARLSRRPHVWHIHEFGYEDQELSFDLGTPLSMWILNRLSAACIANSSAVARQYARYVDATKLSTVYQSVEIPASSSAAEDRTPGEAGDAFRCLIVGALRPPKRQEDAIRAVQELSGMGVPVELVILGDGSGDYRQSLVDLVRRTRLEDRIRFVGHAENPFGFMRGADAILLCSLNEAFGRVTVEGMKLGKAVIATRSGGTTELVRDGETGLLYEPGDFRELAQKIAYLHAHPNVARSLGRNARRWATERFTPERYGDEVLRILARVAGSGAP